MNVNYDHRNPVETELATGARDEDTADLQAKGKNRHAWWFAERPSGFPGRWSWVVFGSVWLALVLFAWLKV